MKKLILLAICIAALTQTLSAAIDIASLHVYVYGFANGDYEIRVEGYDGTAYWEGYDWEVTNVYPAEDFKTALVEITGMDNLTGKCTVVVPLTATASSNALRPTPRVSTAGNNLFLEGLTPSQPYAIYDLRGQLILRDITSPTGAYLLPNLPAGAYILSHNGHRTKFTHP